MEALKEVEKLLAEGLSEKARDMVLRWRLRPGQSPEEYFRWGLLCEQLELKPQAAECYDLAISRDPDCSRYLLARAEVAYELGELPRAATLFQRVLRLADSQTVRQKLARVLTELGRPGAAAAVAGPFEEGPTTKTPLRYFPPNLGFRELEPFQRLFRGRPLHAELQLTSYGKPVPLIKEGSLSLNKISQHLLGRIYLLYFPLTEENKLFGAYLVIAFPQKDVDRNRRNRGFLSLKAEAVKREALSVWHRVQEWGLEGALERFTPFHYRLWFFFPEPIYFLWVRRFFKTLKERLPLPTEGIFYSFEIGTRGEGVGWREVGFELPLGIHPATLERSLFVDPEGHPYPEQLSYLKKIRPLSFNELRTFCRHSLPISFSLGVPSELSKLRQACPIIDYIIKRAEAGRYLRREEKLAIMLSVGFLKNGRKVMHRILSGTPDYNYHRIERMLQGVPKHPISCAKLEVWFRDFVLDRPCGCVFGKALKDRYPSPLLHLDPDLVPTLEDRLTLRYSDLPELGRVYLNIRERFSYVEDLLRKYLRGTRKKIRVGDYIISLEGERIAVRPRSQ